MVDTKDALSVLRQVAMVARGWVNDHRISDNQRAVKSFIEESKRMIYWWFHHRGRKRRIRWVKLAPLLEKVKFPRYFKTIPMVPAPKNTNR